MTRILALRSVAVALALGIAPYVLHAQGLVFYQSEIPWTLMDGPGYDSSPTAIRQASQGLWMYSCSTGGTAPYGDVIKYHKRNEQCPNGCTGEAFGNGAKIGAHAQVNTDSGPTCAPSIVADTDGATEAGNHYLMYYECGPKVRYPGVFPTATTCKDQDQVVGDGVCEGGFFTQICVQAKSGQDETWWKYSKNLPGEGYTMNQDAEAGVIVGLAAAVVNSCGYSPASYSNLASFHYVSSPQNCADPSNYGVGHPSAIRLPNGTIRLYYYSSNDSSFPGPRVLYRDSLYPSDGVHFGPPQSTNLTGPVDVKWYYNGSSVRYVATSVRFSFNYFANSDDGVNFAGPSGLLQGTDPERLVSAKPLDPGFLLGNQNNNCGHPESGCWEGNCPPPNNLCGTALYDCGNYFGLGSLCEGAAPGGPTIVSNPRGQLTAPFGEVEILSAEGKTEGSRTFASWSNEPRGQSWKIRIFRGFFGSQ